MQLYNAYMNNGNMPIVAHMDFWKHYEDNMVSDIDFVNI